MLMKGPSGPFTVPLLAKNNKLVVTVGLHDVQLTASIERLFVYWLYMGLGKGEVIEWLRDVAKISVVPMSYDAFIDDFLNTHPKTPVSDYSLELIPMQADETYGLALPIPYYECIISPNDERELMMLYLESRSDQVYDVIVSWFQVYCKNYGYDFKKCKGSQYEYLYYAFLEQHGIYRYSIKPRTPAEEAEYQSALENKTKNKKRKIWESILRAITLISGYALVMWILWKGGECEDFSMNIRGWCQFGWILMLIGVVWIFFPFLFARNKAELETECETAGGILKAIVIFIVHGFKKDDK